MKMHTTVIDKLLKAYDVWGGHREDTKLKKALGSMDFTVYTRQSDGQEVLVLSEDVQQALVDQG